jgi:hypothetical protein
VGKYGGAYMNKNLLEYIKAGSFVIIAVSLSIIAWNSMKEISYLQGIEDKILSIRIALNSLQQ